MLTLYKYKSDIPYSLHDMCICKIESIGESLKFYFEEGYESCTEPYPRVNGTITIEEVDYDFCDVYLLSDDGNYGTFTGRKLALLDFIEEYKAFSFEVIDENYGYNSVTYNGYLKLPERTDFIELTIAIYHFGNIVYETEE